MGGSSGGSCAFIMAWYHPELYHRVLTYSGTYLNQQWPSNPQTPHGAWEFHEHHDRQHFFLTNSAYRPDMVSYFRPRSLHCASPPLLIEMAIMTGTRCWAIRLSRALDNNGSGPSAPTMNAHTWNEAESAERSGGLHRSEGWGMTCLREEAAPP